MKRSTNGVMGLVAVTVIIGMFIFGGLFIAAITADLDEGYVEETDLIDTVPMVTGMMDIFANLTPLLIGFGVLALVVVAALFFFRAARKHR